MPEVELVSSLTTGGGLTVVSILIHFLRQIRIAIVAVEINFKEMNTALIELNGTMVEVVTDRKRDKEEIDRLRCDIKQLWERVNVKN